jgi:hypothetical protein
MVRRRNVDGMAQILRWCGAPVSSPKRSLTRERPEGWKVRAATKAGEGAQKSLGLRYCHPVAGGWYDPFDREGKLLSSTATVSSFDHALSACAEAEYLLR